MYDEPPGKLLLRSETDLEHHAANDDEPKIGSPDIPRSDDRIKPYGDNGKEHDDLGPIKGIFLAVILSAVFWLAIFAIVARKLL